MVVTVVEGVVECVVEGVVEGVVDGVVETVVVSVVVVPGSRYMYDKTLCVNKWDPIMHALLYRKLNHFPSTCGM